MKILHIIPALHRAGAETALYRLIQATQGLSLDHHVVCLLERGDLASSIESCGSKVTVLRMGRKVPNPIKLFSLRKHIERFNPDVIQTWMYHSDLVGSLAALGLGIPVIWNLRQSDLDSSMNGKRTLLVAKACARLSAHLPTQVVAGSTAAFEAHGRHGYDTRKMKIIPNGFDTQRFSPQEISAELVRERLGLPGGTPLLGFVARLHPHKDHKTLLRAFHIVRQDVPDAHLILLGRDVEATHPYWGTIPKCDAKNIHLLGEQKNPELWLPALSAFVSSSASEGFSNAICEAMACGVPCVVTDVGDSALIVGETGEVAPPRDPAALARGILKILRLTPEERLELSQKARERICINYSVEQIAHEYECLYREVTQCAE